MVIEYTVKPGDIAALYAYTRKHSVKLALIFYGLPIAMAILILAERRSATHSLALADWVIALIWGAAFFVLFPLLLRLRTKKDKRALYQFSPTSFQLKSANSAGTCRG